MSRHVPVIIDNMYTVHLLSLDAVFSASVCDIGILSSICPSVRHVPALYRKVLTYRHNFSTTRNPIILV